MKDDGGENVHKGFIVPSSPILLVIKLSQLYSVQRGRVYSFAHVKFSTYDVFHVPFFRFFVRARRESLGTKPCTCISRTFYILFSCTPKYTNILHTQLLFPLEKFFVVEPASLDL